MVKGWKVLSCFILMKPPINRLVAWPDGRASTGSSGSAGCRDARHWSSMMSVEVKEPI